MAINETISTGNKYRRLKDASTKLWQRLSFWTKASDVEFDNGATAETSLGNIQGITDSVNSNASNIAASAAAVNTLNSKLSSFQTGVDTLYDKYVSKGVTPSGKTLNEIIRATDNLYDTAYANGSENSSKFNKDYKIILSGGSINGSDTSNGGKGININIGVTFNPYTGTVSCSGGASAGARCFNCSNGDQMFWSWSQNASVRIQ